MSGFEAVDPRYEQLFARVSEVLGADERVAEVRLSGSIAAGAADAHSDLDVQVIARSGAGDSLLASWPRWLAAITPSVFARTSLAPHILNVLTDDGLPLDIVVYEGRPPPPYVGPSGYRAAHLASQPFDDLGEALDYVVAEQLRGLAGPFISLLLREEHVRHLTGVAHIVGLLTTVFVAETGAPPLGKHWNRDLTAEQRDAVAALPPVSATREGLQDFGLGLARLVVERARPLFPRYGLVWPTGLANVAAARVREHLGVETADWLH